MGKKRVERNVKNDDYIRLRVGQLVKVSPAWIFKEADLWTSPQSLFTKDKVLDRLVEGELCLVLAVEVASYKVVVGDRIGWIDFNEVCEA